ncbi:TatD family hydrolase [Cytobacillus oceanisediminis]|uniref:TatD family hydrolase n=1 Tax=Cytobacillus oceanisediminis TaxID=665099 RepID=UPI001C241BA0|nr:TatD family hydrolase [Cytobacillus oceanisediminis]MBU8772014.1 TatD family hydrolase [Cytobacillus oceanisediminis]
MNNLSDMHVHIDYFKNYKQMFNSFERNKTYALFVTNLPEIFQKCLNNFSVSKYVKLGLGYNPQLVETYPFNQRLFDSMLPLTKYVGEVGLDYSKEFVHTKMAQKKAFDYICYQSAKTKSIMSIHSRGAERDVLTTLKANGVEHAIFHWYSGNKEEAHKILEQGYYFSVNYSMLSTRKGFEFIKSIPMDRLLIETDAPFGKTHLRGISYNLPEIYDQFSKKLGVEKIENIIYKNLSTLLLKQGNY